MFGILDGIIVGILVCIIIWNVARFIDEVFLDDFFGDIISNFCNKKESMNKFTDEDYEIDTLFVDRQDCVDGLSTNVDKDKVYIEYRYKWNSHMLIFYHKTCTKHYHRNHKFFIKLSDTQFDKKMELCKKDLTNYAENFIKNLRHTCPDEAVENTIRNFDDILKGCE